MNADSADLDAKLAQACDEGAASRRQLARPCRVSVALIQKLRRRLTGRLAAAAQTGGRRGVLDAEALALVARLIRKPNDLTLAELCARGGCARGARQRPDDVPGRAPPPAAVQKQLLQAAERDTPRVQAERALYRELSATLDRRRVQCIAESGIKLALTRLYGRAPRGERARGRAPQHDGQNVTILGALSCTGLEAVMTVEGATDADVCRASGHAVWCPTLREGDIVIADHLSAHQAAGVPEAIAAQGARRLDLPPYAPDLNPSEPCWSKLKTCLREGAHARGT